MTDKAAFEKLICKLAQIDISEICPSTPPNVGTRRADNGQIGIRKAPLPFDWQWDRVLTPENLATCSLEAQVSSTRFGNI